VASGGTALDPEVVSQLVSASHRSAGLAALTPRERDVLTLMAEGRSNAGIATALVVSASVVEKHVARVFDKLGLSSVEADNRRVLAVLRYLSLFSRTGNGGRPAAKKPGGRSAPPLPPARPWPFAPLSVARTAPEPLCARTYSGRRRPGILPRMSASALVSGGWNQECAVIPARTASTVASDPVRCAAPGKTPIRYSASSRAPGSGRCPGVSGMDTIRGGVVTSSAAGSPGPAGVKARSLAMYGHGHGPQRWIRLARRRRRHRCREWRQVVSLFTGHPYIRAQVWLTRLKEVPPMPRGLGVRSGWRPNRKVSEAFGSIFKYRPQWLQSAARSTSSRACSWAPALSIDCARPIVAPDGDKSASAATPRQCRDLVSVAGGRRHPRSTGSEPGRALDGFLMRVLPLPRAWPGRVWAEAREGGGAGSCRGLAPLAAVGCGIRTSLKLRM
jgi:DNA-binding CsgD family transcriptional regulator